MGLRQQGGGEGPRVTGKAARAANDPSALVFQFWLTLNGLSFTACRPLPRPFLDPRLGEEKEWW